MERLPRTKIDGTNVQRKPGLKVTKTQTAPDENFGNTKILNSFSDELSQN